MDNIMNLIENLIERIEDYRKENKNPCKSYKTYEIASKKAVEIAIKGANYFGVDDIEYVVFYNPHWQRFNVAFRLPRNVGGYMCFFSDFGFYSY